MHTLLSPAVQASLGGSSVIRKMFEQGIELKKKFGAENVYDFSLGNPDLPPPPAVREALLHIAQRLDRPRALGYMPNAGYPQTREALAKLISREQGVEVPSANVLVTVGAAGGLNDFFRATLTPGDEVLVPCPYFVEYGFYCGNFGGKLVPVPTDPEDFSLDLAAIEKAITPRTRAIIINTPNNPTGQIYPAEDLRKLGDILAKASEANGRTVFLVSDEPYRALNYEGAELPSMFSVYANTVVVGSFSKTLCLAGERIGYVAVNPAIGPDAADLMAGLVLANRVLGAVNAPAIGQQILDEACEAKVDVAVYRRRRDLMAKNLTDAGLRFFLPKGAFYFFVKTPTEDETVFIDALLREHVLAVPGRGFGQPGYMRLAFCVEDEVIERAHDAFVRAMAPFRV